MQLDSATFFRSLIVIKNVVVMSYSRDSDFEGFLKGSFDVDVVKRRHDTVDSDSDISLDENISDGTDHDENDMFHVYFNGNHEDMHSEKIL